MGAVNIHCGERYDDREYNNIMVRACADAGIAAFTGDGVVPEVMTWACDAIAAAEADLVPAVAVVLKT